MFNDDKKFRFLVGHCLNIVFDGSYNVYFFYSFLLLTCFIHNSYFEWISNCFGIEVYVLRNELAEDDGFNEGLGTENDFDCYGYLFSSMYLDLGLFLSFCFVLKLSLEVMISLTNLSIHFLHLRWSVLIQSIHFVYGLTLNIRYFKIICFFFCFLWKKSSSVFFVLLF